MRQSPGVAVQAGVMGCVFCEIIAGDRPGHMVMDDGSVAALLDHSPLFPGHVLVVPRRHVVTIEDLEPAAVGPLFAVVQRMAEVVRTTMGAQGTFVALNNTVSQSVPHLHVHVVPRVKGDGLRGFFWPRRRYGPGEAEVVASRLRDAWRESTPV